MPLPTLPLHDLSRLNDVLEALPGTEREHLPDLSAELFPGIADYLRLWQLCRSTVCRRARACRGNQTACCRRADLPAEVRAWFLDMGEAIREDSFEQALEEVDAELTAAVMAWCSALKAVEECERHRRGVFDDFERDMAALETYQKNSARQPYRPRPPRS